MRRRGRGVSARLPILDRPRRERDAVRQAPAKTPFFMVAWTPQLPSTPWVMPKSTATDIRETATDRHRIVHRGALADPPVVDVAADVVGRDRVDDVSLGGS